MLNTLPTYHATLFRMPKEYCPEKSSSRIFLEWVIKMNDSPFSSKKTVKSPKQGGFNCNNKCLALNNGGDL